MCVFYNGPVCTCECVGGNIQCRQLEILKLLQRARENKREETPAQEREAKRGTSTGSLCTGPELMQSESPYRKKAGSSQQRSSPAHTNAHSLTHMLEQNNTRASVSAQQFSSGSSSCLDLQLCAKNNKDQDNVGTDMQHSPYQPLMSTESRSLLGQILPLCDIGDERGLGIPMLWSVPRLPSGDAKTVRWKIVWFLKLTAGILPCSLFSNHITHLFSFLFSWQR